MKKIILLSLVSVWLVSCANQTVTQPTPVESVPPPVETPPAEVPASPATELQVGEFTLDEISGRGCGMTLWKADRESRDRFVFFNGINPGSMEMRIDGQIIKFTRSEGTGDEFYGQQTSQLFQSEDGSTTVTVDVVLGAKGEIETVAIDEGTIRVVKNGQEVTMPVVGNAGC